MTTSDRWTDEVRELAYQLWAYTCGRNATRVARVMEDEHDVSVPVRTIQHWAATDDWSTRVRDDLSSIAPDLHQTIVSELILGAVESARVLRRSVGDSDADRPDKNQITAAFGLLDRAGYSPLGRVAPVQPASTPQLESLPDLSLLSIEAIEEIEQRRLEELRTTAADRLRAKRRG